MTEPMLTSDQNPPQAPGIQFGEEIILEEAGFSFHPIIGFELEVDGSVYMYSDDGNLEISLVGGELDNQTSIAELNDELAAEFMTNFDEVELIKAGKDDVQGITGFLNRIHFINAEEEGLGMALICSPHINQFFFMLVISSAEHWEKQGFEVFTALKAHIHFHPQFKPEASVVEVNEHPDLTVETFETINSQESAVITIERGDISLLMAARTARKSDQITVTEIIAPGGQALYRYTPSTGDLASEIGDQPLTSSHGELCLHFPFANQQSLQIGAYQFTFATQSGAPLQEVQVIIRQGRALDMQKLDLNLWLALENEHFNQPEYLYQFGVDLRVALREILAPMNLTPGKITFYHPAPDELTAFACINLDSDLADCSYMIAETVENSRALNIGLVERLTRGDPPEDAGVSAVSSGTPGMILSPVSPHACVLVNYTDFIGDFPGLARALVEQLVRFCGGHIESGQSDQPLVLNRDVLWRLRRHPIFYDAE
jgi:hypothetical protein